MTDETFAAMVALLEETYREEWPSERKRVWRMLLEPLIDAEIRWATVRLCQTSPYPPKPADIWHFAQEYREMHRVPEWHPALREPSDQKVADKYLTFMREAVRKIGKTIQ